MRRNSFLANVMAIAMSLGASAQNFTRNEMFGLTREAVKRGRGKYRSAPGKRGSKRWVPKKFQRARARGRAPQFGRKPAFCDGCSKHVLVAVNGKEPQTYINPVCPNGKSHVARFTVTSEKNLRRMGLLSA
jgi:hypothetical protein